MYLRTGVKSTHLRLCFSFEAGVAQTPRIYENFDALQLAMWKMPHFWEHNILN